MGATEEQMVLLSSAHVTHVSYILILFSIAFLLFLFTIILLHLYAVHAFPPPAAPLPADSGYDRATTGSSSGSTAVDADVEAQRLPAHGGLNGHAAGAGVSDAERRRVKDAQEYELDALISDESDSEGRHKHTP